MGNSRDLPALPAPATPLLGRRRELARLAALLRPTAGGDAPARLVTLTGPGGVGKTRLAVQAAGELAAAFDHAAIFVPLEAVREPGDVAWAIIGQLGLQVEGRRPVEEQLARYLADRRSLIILDNFEQVLQAATLVADLLARAPQLAVLATSRAPLRLSGEYEFPVAPLALPDPAGPLDAATVSRADAVALFLRRAAMAAPAFRLTDENAPLVAEICLRLDGLPLALELAAARLKFLTPRELLTRLARRFSLLIGGGRDLPDRQRTLRETVAWSYGLLAVREQTLLRRLAIFSDGCTPAAVQAVLGAIGGELAEPDVLADGLAALIDQSLLSRDEGPAGESRLRMLETIRDYGRDQLAEQGELDAARRAHAAHYLALAEESRSWQAGADQGRWLAQVARELGNLRAAFDQTLAAGERELALRLGAALVPFWQLRGYQREGLRLLELGLARDEDIAERPLACAYSAAGQLALFLGDAARARRYLDRGLALFRRAGDPRELGELLSGLGWARSVWRDYAGAEEAFRESASLSLQLGHHGSAAWAFNGLGTLARRRGAYDEAIEQHRQGLALFAEDRDEWGIAFTRTAFGLAYLQRGDLERAAAAYRDALAAYRALGSAGGVAAALDGLALVAIARGDDRRAARLFGAAQAAHDAPVVGVTVLNRDERDAALAALRARLGETMFTAAQAAGRDLSVTQALAEATTPAAPRPARGEGLTPRELAALRLVAQGLSDAEVADRLFLSRRTVQSYLSTAYGKLGVKSRTAAVHRALDLGWLDPG